MYDLSMIRSRVQAFVSIWDLGSYSMDGISQRIGLNQESLQTSYFEEGEESIRDAVVAIVA